MLKGAIVFTETRFISILRLIEIVGIADDQSSFGTGRIGTDAFSCCWFGS